MNARLRDRIIDAHVWSASTERYAQQLPGHQHAVRFIDDAEFNNG